MKWLLIIPALLLLLGLVAYTFMAIQSQKTPERLGLKQGVLLPCPDSPNCVCSEAHSQGSGEHAIAPVQAADGAWAKLKKRMIDLGGIIEQDDGHYLHATFRSPLFRYVDDVELRLDSAQGLIHIRSASRVGRSDFGVNRKRVEQIVQ
ncbi:MAG: DUF1499 domain-containing protein [Zetaproteobacteria bacterium CG12_big_fil_rev_8_21_14_0_65_54_13]|nr:MAG: hypothetical protein COX55_00775 [Zetaproteobacteria bacterium CG23_combo_of_CG06-09_8_20_14_all_54_7]PIW47866.1 MAG: DUF1499 domain-containing protein [Zetaproteobacteria bacterium CG12_big_fil_rev_8_21_14_0_65_54_13]PIX55003.1 MAG: DUF1499 domain-containing protein [Zetaproteobacteria bacterium CG_4_10_14_3_um_filter_54_28]PJA28957.1 MAG: DUF1499 domain-containing protein [Zetaproteobacteria bacterium CG_4_9_14_3_um_filter_54_145]